MKLGLGARLALVFALLAALTALLTAAVSATSTSRKVNSDVDRFLESRSAEIAEGRRADIGLARGGRNPGPRNDRPRDNPLNQPQNDADGVPDTVIDELRSLVESDAEVQTLSREGNVVVSLGVALPIEDADIALLEKRGPLLLRTVQIDGEDYRMVTRHVEGGGAVQVAQSLTTTNELLGDLRSELLLVGLAMSGLAGLLGWGIAQGTTRPLRRLTKQVEGVAATEDLSTTLKLDRSDEIGRLSEEFDGLLKTLGASRDQQQRLVQDAAHELRTPLTSVRANIDFLERARDLDASERQSTLASIKAELAELSSVLAEVVELATEAPAQASFEDVDLAVVAEIALSHFELRSDRPVVRELSPCIVHGDQATLVRAASNLIGNADKYSPARLPIIVTVADGSLSVADQGPGIDASERARVFDRFYRSDRDRSETGSGLGLAIVAKAATEHAGSAWAREAPGGGAHVGITLPLRYS